MRYPIKHSHYGELIELGVYRYLKGLGYSDSEIVNNSTRVQALSAAADQVLRLTLPGIIAKIRNENK